MFVEQIIEFELRGPGSPIRTCTTKPGYFHNKTKSLKQILEQLLTAKNITESNVLASFTWAKSLTKFNPQMQDLKRVLDLICK